MYFKLLLTVFFIFLNLATKIFGDTVEYLGFFDNTAVYKVDLSADRDIILHSNGNNRTITGLKSGLNI